ERRRVGRSGSERPGQRSFRRRRRLVTIPGVVEDVDDAGIRSQRPASPPGSDRLLVEPRPDRGDRARNAARGGPARAFEGVREVAVDLAEILPVPLAKDLLAAGERGGEEDARIEREAGEARGRGAKREAALPVREGDQGRYREDGDEEGRSEKGEHGDRRRDREVGDEVALRHKVDLQKFFSAGGGCRPGPPGGRRTARRLSFPRP